MLDKHGPNQTFTNMKKEINYKWSHFTAHSLLIRLFVNKSLIIFQKELFP